MRLWYQSLARDNQATPYGVLLKKVIASCVDAGTEVHIHGIAESAGIGVHYRVLEHHDTTEVIKNALRAEKEGYDAFLLGNISDAGLAEAREMVNIPCLGLCETSMHLACMMGESFGFVMISRKWSARVLENVRRCGLERRFAGAEPLDTSPLELRYADTRHREQIIARFTEAAERLLDRGAEVIIPGGGDIIAYLVEAGIYEIGRAPIVNGIIELVKMAETAVKLKALTGRFTSRRLGYATPSGDFLERIRSFYGPDVYPGAE